MSDRLAAKVAVVTGAAGGIGSAAVRLFAAEGCRVIALDCDDVVPADLPGAARTIALDLTAGGAVEKAFAAVQVEFGRLDILFNIAGGSGRRFGDGPVDVCSEAGWDHVLDVNLRSAFLCCKYAIPLLRRSGGGSIINTSSVLGLVGHELFDTHAYAAAKGALIALSRAMAVKYAPEHIRVNVLCPGLIHTPMSLRAQSDAQILEALEHLQPLTGDFGAPEDVAAAALYLASDESRFITGTVLPIDGGWTAR